MVGGYGPGGLPGRVSRRAAPCPQSACAALHATCRTPRPPFASSQAWAVGWPASPPGGMLFERLRAHPGHRQCCQALAPQERRRPHLLTQATQQTAGGSMRPHLAVELDGQLAQLLRVAHCIAHGRQACGECLNVRWTTQEAKFGQTPASRAAVVDSGGGGGSGGGALKRQQAPWLGCPALAGAPLVNISSLPAFCSSMAFIYSSPRTAYCALSRSSAETEGSGQPACCRRDRCTNSKYVGSRQSAAPVSHR